MSEVNASRPHWLVNIAFGNGLVPSGNKPLPKLLLTKISDAICVTRPQWVNMADILKNDLFWHINSYEFLTNQWWPAKQW